VLTRSNLSTGLTTQIEIDVRGVGWVAGTNTKVKEIVLDKLAYGWSPEEMHFQHPHLSMAQIHAALACYYENQDKLDDEIRRDLEEVDELRSQSESSTLRSKLQSIRKSR
jgi:uncharacterized protein (DUF433 family)